MSFESSLLPLPLPVPEACRQWITLNVEFRVFVCQAPACQHALFPNTIGRHLRDKHRANPELQRQIERYIKACSWVYSLQSIPLPPDGSLPQPVLPVHAGFRCKDCQFKTRSRQIIRKHGNVEHKKRRLPDDLLFQAVSLQTWLTEKRARYWAVELNATRLARDNNIGDVEENGRGSGSGIGDDSAAIKAGISTWTQGAEAEAEARYKASGLATEIDLWLQYTGWEPVLAGSKYGLVETAAFAATATADELELELILESWGRILQRSLDTLQAIDSFKDILKWWGSPKNEVASQRPFERPATKTVLRYGQTFARLLCYVWRTATADVVATAGETETGVVFSEEQLTSVDEVRVAVADQDNHAMLDSTVMGLIMSLICQDTSQLHLYHSPVMHYMAVRSIDLQTKGFFPSFRYTPFLAHMIWMIRLLILERTVSEIGWPELEIPSRAELGAVAGAVAERIQTARKRHLCEGSFSPASSILSQLAYGQKLNRDQSSDANIYWADDRQTVFLDGKGVAMAKVQAMCQLLTTELEGLLGDLVFHQRVPPVPLPQLVDSMGTAQQFQQIGYGFLDHPANVRWKMGWEFLWEQMLRGGRSLVTRAGGSGSDRGSGRDHLHWAEQPCKAYLAREKQFLLKLMVAMHLTGGQPARSPEIGSIKVRNSAVSSRNIFVINGRVAVVTTYDKAQRRRGKIEYVFRCFPDQLSQVIVQYLVYVLPFTRVLQKTKGDFLFATEQEPWVQNQLSTAVAAATAKHLGVRLTVASWRHVAIAISDEHLRKASRIWKQDRDRDDDGAAVAEEDDEDVEQGLFEQVLVRQSGHSKHTAEMHYAIDGAFLNRLGPDLVSAYSQASRAWHLFLRLASHGAAVAAVVVGVKRPGGPVAPDVKRVQRSGSTAVQGLQRILGAAGQPKSAGQAQALELVHTATATQPQIIVLGTGSGKSLLFFSVAAMTAHQTVIVVVPFAALVDDLVRRAHGYHLTCDEWQWPRPWKVLPQLLIVSADRAVESNFLHFAKGLELHQQLAHVFFDECHVAVTDTSYRAKLRELWQLRYLQCRFTCLTATLLTCLEPVLRANLLLEQAQVYRQSTMRPTIRYQVVDCQRDGLWETAEPVLRRLPLPPGSRGIIYVRSYSQGEEIAEAIDCPFYKATATDKQEQLEEWTSGRGGWIIATGALGTGIDIPGVVFIIHIGRPYGLTSFMQQAGRGGRAGEVSDSMVFVASSRRDGGGGSGSVYFPAPRQEVVSAYSVEAQDETALTEYLEGGTCRRAILARHLDGQLQGGDCPATDSILCDQCQLMRAGDSGSGSFGSRAGDIANANHSFRDSGAGVMDSSNTTVIHGILRDEIGRDEQLTRFHQSLHAYCIYCKLMREEDESHCHSDCPHALTRHCDIQTYRQWRSKLKLATRHQCFRCGLSQSLCTAIDDQTTCLYPHLLLPAFFFFHQTGYLPTVCHELGFQGREGEPQWQWQWLNHEGEGLFGQREVNWMRVWRRVAQVWEGDWEF